MKQFVQFVHCFFIRKCAALLWFASEFVWEVPGYRFWHFLSNAPQSLYCGALQDVALRCSHQSASHTVEETQRTWHNVFKFRCITFVVFALMRTICTVGVVIYAGQKFMLIC